MPRGVADWLGQHADCHNVAMELLIASYTGMPPIKVCSGKGEGGRGQV